MNTVALTSIDNTNVFPATSYQGLLLIGDPHLEARVPGFRCDDYPRVILEKLGWCLDYASREALFPVILGDLFQLPRDNPNWLLGEVISLFDPQIVGIYGNHDVQKNQLDENDSLDIVIKSGKLLLLDEDHVFRGLFNGRPVVLGGTSWGQRIPASVPEEVDSSGTPATVIWITHHDVKVPGYEEQGYFPPRELPGIDLVVNGHIHRHLESVKKGQTLWTTPGNIARRSRSDASRDHIPSVFRVDLNGDGWETCHVEIPHRPFDEVFHAAVINESADGVETTSDFISGLAELQARRTDSGAGLMTFLEKNVVEFDDDVAAEIMKLATEVTSNE